MKNSDQLIKLILKWRDDRSVKTLNALESWIDKQIAAVLAEREACAKLVEARNGQNIISDRIRARSK